MKEEKKKRIEQEAERMIEEESYTIIGCPYNLVEIDEIPRRVVCIVFQSIMRCQNRIENYGRISMPLPSVQEVIGGIVKVYEALRCPVKDQTIIYYNREESERSESAYVPPLNPAGFVEHEKRVGELKEMIEKQSIDPKVAAGELILLEFLPCDLEPPSFETRFKEEVFNLAKEEKLQIPEENKEAISDILELVL